MIDPKVFRERIADLKGKLDPKYLPPDLITYQIKPYIIDELFFLEKERSIKEGYLTEVYQNGKLKYTHFFTLERDAKNFGENVANTGL